MADENLDELKALRKKAAILFDALEDIALIADGHRKSTAYDEAGNNIALSVILGRAATAVGWGERLQETGTVIAPVGTVVR